MFRTFTIALFCAVLATGPVDAHMGVALEAIRMHHPDAEQTLSDVLTVSTPQGPIALQRQVFAVTGPDGAPQRTSLLIGERGGYHVTFRLTYPASSAPVIEPAFDAILKELVWPRA